MNALPVLVALGLVALAYGIKRFLDNVPEGYEDESGFHIGKRPQS